MTLPVPQVTIVQKLKGHRHYEYSFRLDPAVLHLKYDVEYWSGYDGKTILNDFTKLYAGDQIRVRYRNDDELGPWSEWVQVGLSKEQVSAAWNDPWEAKNPSPEDFPDNAA